MIAWHRLFGLALQDLLATSPYQVEVEKDLSVQQQRIDIIIEQGDRAGAVVIDLPDGLDNLAKYNLMTYKSLRQSFRSTKRSFVTKLRFVLLVGVVPDVRN